jgi:hypothetical protein
MGGGPAGAWSCTVEQHGVRQHFWSRHLVAPSARASTASRHARLGGSSPRPTLMIIRDATVVDLAQTRRPVHPLGGKRPSAVECQHIVSIQKRHRFQRFAALELPKDALAYRAQQCRQHRIESLPHLRVTRNMGKAVDTPSIAVDPLFVKGEQRRRCEGKQGERRHECIR